MTNRELAIAAAMPEVARTRPRWDIKTRELWFRGRLVKRFLVPARNQVLILTVFEEEEWTPCIYDPLPFKTGVNRWQRLKAVIRHLNACQVNPIIRFHGNGTGDGIRWEDVAS